MTETALDLYRAAIGVLLHAIREEQKAHATAFLLDELERLHVATGSRIPAWVNVLRFPSWGGPYEM